MRSTARTRWLVLRKRAEYLRSKLDGAPRGALGYANEELNAINWAIEMLEPAVKSLLKPGEELKIDREHIADLDPFDMKDT